MWLISQSQLVSNTDLVYGGCVNTLHQHSYQCTESREIPLLEPANWNIHVMFCVYLFRHMIMKRLKYDREQFNTLSDQCFIIFKLYLKIRNTMDRQSYHTSPCSIDNGWRYQGLRSELLLGQGICNSSIIWYWSYCWCNSCSGRGWLSSCQLDVYYSVSTHHK